MRVTAGDGHPSGPPVLLRGWVFFLVVAIGVLAGTFLYAQSQPTVYTSSSVVALTPKGPRPASAGVVVLTAPRYVAYATSPFALRQVAAPLGLDANELRDSLIVTMGALTANITIQVTLTDPQDAADVADALAVLVLKRAAADPILAAQVVSTAVTPNSPSGPNRAAIFGGGVVAALVAGLVVALLVERYHQRRRAVVARGVATVGLGAPGAAVPSGAVPSGAVPSGAVPSGAGSVAPGGPAGSPVPAASAAPPADATTELAVLRDLPGERSRSLPSDETIMLDIDPSIFDSPPPKRSAAVAAADHADDEADARPGEPVRGQLRLDDASAEAASTSGASTSDSSTMDSSPNRAADDGAHQSPRPSEAGERATKPSPTPSRS